MDPWLPHPPILFSLPFFLPLLGSTNSSQPGTFACRLTICPASTHHVTKRPDMRWSHEADLGRQPPSLLPTIASTMSSQEWDRKVFRLRGIPSYISSRAAAADLLSNALGLSSSDVVVYSLARSSDIWETPATRVATLQFKGERAPPRLQSSSTNNQWTLPLAAETSDYELILDTHFEGMTALNDVDPAKHVSEYVAIGANVNSMG